MGGSWRGLENWVLIFKGQGIILRFISPSLLACIASCLNLMFLLSNCHEQPMFFFFLLFN